MANDNIYGVVLNDVQDTSRVIEGPGGSGGTATALDALAKGLGAVTSRWEDQARQKRMDAEAARQARQDARQAEQDQRSVTEQAAESAAAIGLNLINTGQYTDQFGELTPPPALHGEVSKVVTKVQSIDTAVDQGRMPPISREAAVNALYQNLVAKFGPEWGGVIAKSFRDNGVGNALTHEIATELETADKQRNAIVEFETKARETAISNLPAEAVREMDDAALVRWGLDYSRTQNEMDMLQKQATLQSTQTNTQQSQYNFEKQQNADRYGVLVTDQVMSAVQPLAQQMQQLLVSLGDPGTDPANEERLSRLVGLARMSASNIINTAIARGGYTSIEEANQARTFLTKYVEDTLISPYENRNKDFAAATEVINQRMGLTAKISAPIIYDLRTKFGLSGTDIATMLGAAPEELLTGLRREFQNVGRPGINQNIATIQLGNIISVLQGEKNLSHIDTPRERQQVMATVYPYVRNNAGDVAAGRGNPDMWLNGARQLVIATQGINPQTEVSTLRTVTSGILSSNSVQAVNKLLSDGATKEEAQVLGSSMRASAAIVLQSARAKIRGSVTDPKGPYRVAADESGHFRIVNNPNWKPSNRNTGLYSGPGTLNAPSNVRPEISPQLRDTVNVANIAMDFLVTTGQWDGDAPKGTPREVRRFWGLGEPTASQRTAQGSKPKKGDINRMFDTLERDLQKAPELLEAPDVVDQIIGDESGGDPTARNPRSSATGAGQFISSTWLDLIKRERPDVARGKSDRELLALRNDPKLSRQMTGAYARQNSQVLVDNGLAASNVNISMMHLLGPGEGIRALKASPSTRMESIVSQQTLNANPWMRGKTVADLKEMRG